MEPIIMSQTDDFSLSDLLGTEMESNDFLRPDSNMIELLESAKKSSTLLDLVHNYYKNYPDTLMPLLFLSLATKGKISVSEDSTPNSSAYKVFNLEEMAERVWVKNDELLKSRVDDLLASDIHFINITLELDTQTAGIYSLFKEHDEVTVVHEYHERIGRLVDHMRIDKLQKDYSLLIMIEEFLKQQDVLQEQFLELFDEVLCISGLQPKRSRLEIAEMLKALIDYDGKGLVYNPFAGISYIGTMLKAGDHLIADGHDPRILAAGQLLNYGMGGNNSHFKKHDSTQWVNEKKLDYVVSTYRGYVSGVPALTFCLSKCFESLSANGKYAGVIKSDELFDKDIPAIKKAIDMDWLDTIVVMPYNETVLLFDKAKKTPGIINLYNRMIGLAGFWSPSEMLTECSDEKKVISVKKLIRSGYNLRKYVVHTPEPISGQKLVSIKKFIKPIPRATYSLDGLTNREKAMLCINHDIPYEQLPNGWMEGLEKTHIDRLLSPAYKLDHDSLIINPYGNIEPKLFDADRGTAYFDEGLAFELKPCDIDWLMHELCSPYVLDQLHPYGIDEMMPNQNDEDRFLKLKLYEPSSKSSENENVLKAGFTLENTSNNMKYTILCKLSNGSFGITYKALQEDLQNGDTKEVVIKECFMENNCYRENGIVKYHDEYAFRHNYKQFKQEAEIMMKLGNVRESHIMPVSSFFHSDKTDTAYYVMKFFTNGDLDGEMKRRGTLDEPYIINNVVKPICKALHIAHSAKLMHLDIKPDNIMIDEFGLATLTDFGLAKLYDAEDKQLSEENPNGCRYFAAPEQVFREEGNALVSFAPQTDIYLLAGTIYYLMTRQRPHHIMDFSDQDKDIRENLQNCSDKTKDAIVAGLQNSAKARPASAQAFLNLFPGCENIKL